MPEHRCELGSAQPKPFPMVPAQPLPAPHEPYRALYLHVPFCVRRCAYCDFRTDAVAAASPSIDAYIERLCLSIRRASRAGELDAIETVYLGGGTPSHVGMGRLSMLLYTLGLSLRLEPDVECSMEANPESLTPNMVRDVWALGVNRLSIGVQSFDDGVLRTIGRAHDAAGACRAIEAAHERFENVSVDLMCGIPGQTDDSLAASVRRAVELGVSHVSVYPLTIEEGTPFDRLVAQGSLPAPDDDVEARHMEIAERILRDAGFERYEVASYARPGFACKHNIAYWTGVPYLGIGDGAASMAQGRGVRVRFQDGAVTDELDEREVAAEDLMLGMRMTRGVSQGAIERATRLLPDAPAAFSQLEAAGLVERSGGRLRPTERGWLCGNELYGSMYELAP